MFLLLMHIVGISEKFLISHWIITIVKHLNGIREIHFNLSSLCLVGIEFSSM